MGAADRRDDASLGHRTGPNRGNPCRRARRRAGRQPKALGAAAGCGAPDQAERGRGDDPQRGEASPHQAQIDGEFVAAGDQLTGAIDRIDQHEIVCSRANGSAGARLLGDDRHARQELRHAREDDGFGGVVGRRHRRLISFDARIERAGAGCDNRRRRL